MAEQFQLILVGMFIGSAIVWILTRKKVKELERKLEEGNPLEAFSQKQQEEKQERKAKILELLQNPLDGTRGKPFDETQGKQITITNNQVEKMLGVSDATATNYLQELEDENKIEQIGERGRFVSYRLKTNG